MCCRNVPADVDEEQLKTLFQQFGRVQYCRAVVNQDTGMCKGGRTAQSLLLPSVMAFILSQVQHLSSSSVSPVYKSVWRVKVILTLRYVATIFIMTPYCSSDPILL